MTPQAYSELVHALTLACHDPEESNRRMAADMWLYAGLDAHVQGNAQVEEALSLQLADDLTHACENVRTAAAEALAALIKNSKANTRSMCHRVLVDLIRTKWSRLSEIREPEVDQFGRRIGSASEADLDVWWESRVAVAHTLTQLAECIPATSDGSSGDVYMVFEFLVKGGGLNDRNASVRNKMLEAAIAALNFHGRTHIDELLPLFEQFLQDTQSKGASYDAVRQNVVILMGTLAKHLDKDDAKVAPIIGKLVQVGLLTLTNSFILC